MFEPEKLHFSFVDLLSSPRRALRSKKIWTQLIGLVIGYLFYLVLTYIALLLNGMSLAAVWERWGLYPFFPLNGSEISNVVGWICYGLGVLLWLLCILLSTTVVSRMTYKELKGDLFYSIRDGWAFTRKHWRAVIFSPVAVTLIIIFFLVLAGIMALVGKIPYVGEAVFVGFYPIYFIGAVFVLYSCAVLLILVLYLPAIVSCWEEDAMGSSFQAYTITWSQPWRIVTYATLTGGLAVAGTYLYGWVITGGYHLVNIIFGAPGLMESKLGPILAWAENLTFTGYNQWFCYIPGKVTALSPLSAGIPLADVSGWEAFIGSLLALSLLLIYASALAYGLSIISVGQSISYLIYKMKTEDENLLERRDEEEVWEEEEDESEEIQGLEDPSAEG